MMGFAHMVIALHLLAAAAEDGEAPAPVPATSCVSATARVRYSLGYDHLVDVKNGCEKDVRCEVWTNVNPEHQTVILGVGRSATVVTFLGSPARTFTPEVACEYVQS